MSSRLAAIVPVAGSFHNVCMPNISLGSDKKNIPFVHVPSQNLTNPYQRTHPPTHAQHPHHARHPPYQRTYTNPPILTSTTLAHPLKGFLQSPTSKVPVMDIHGTSDKTVPGNASSASAKYALSADGWYYEITGNIASQWCVFPHNVGVCTAGVKHTPKSTNAQKHDNTQQTHARKYYMHGSGATVGCAINARNFS